MFDTEAKQAASREMEIAMDAFLNRLKSLRFIDRSQLPELTREEWPDFRDNPTHYFVCADDLQQAAIWREIEKSQHPSSRSDPSEQANHDLARQSSTWAIASGGCGRRDPRLEAEWRLFVGIMSRVREYRLAAETMKHADTAYCERLAAQYAASGDELYGRAVRRWTDAVCDVHGKIFITWTQRGYTQDCTLGTGEVFRGDEPAGDAA